MDYVYFRETHLDVKDVWFSANKESATVLLKDDTRGLGWTLEEAYVSAIKKQKDTTVNVVPGRPFCLNCGKILPYWVKEQDSFLCVHCGSREYDYEIKED